MRTDIEQAWLAMACMMALAVMIMWPDAVMAQQEGAEVIRAGAEWVISLFKLGAALFLVLGFFGAVASLVNSNIGGAALSFFAMIVAAAILWGADAAVARFFGTSV